MPAQWRPITSRIQEAIAEEQARIDAIQAKRKWAFEPLPITQPIVQTFPETVSPWIPLAQTRTPLTTTLPISDDYTPPRLPSRVSGELGYTPSELPDMGQMIPTIGMWQPSLTSEQSLRQSFLAKQPAMRQTAVMERPAITPLAPPREFQWWEQPAQLTEKVMGAVGTGISKVPVLPKVLQFAAPAFEFIHEKLEKPWASIITAPFSPSLSWKSGESWLEHEKREYEAWKAPTYVKGLAEFAMPLWWIPWFSWAKATAKPLIGAGTAARMAAILPKKASEALLPTYDALTSFVPDNLVKRAVLKTETIPILNRMVKVVGGEAAFTRRNPITAADKARNYAVFWGQHREIGENIVRTKMNDLTVKRIVQEADKQVFKSEDDLFKLFDQKLFKGERVNAKVGIVTTDATHPGIKVGKEVSYYVGEVWQDVNSYKWADTPLGQAAKAYVKEGHDIEGWMRNWAEANGVKIPSQKRGLKIVDEVIQEHITRIAKGVVKEEGIAVFKRTDPFREMIYETMREGVEAGVKYGGTFADRVNLMSRAIARKVAQKKFDNAVKPMGRTLLEMLEASEPDIVARFTAQANRVDALKRGLVSLEKNKPVHYATMALIKEEFPDLAKAIEGITAITPQVASDYIKAMAKSSTLILDKNRLPLISELLSSTQNSFYDVYSIVSKYTRSGASATRLSSAWYKQQLKARATEYRGLLKQVKDTLGAETPILKTQGAEVAKLKRGLRVAKAEKLEARFHNHPAFNNRIFSTEVVEILDPILGDRGSNWIRQLAQVSGLSRMVTATLDLSAPFIQGTALFGRNPVAWAKATGQMLGIAARPQNLYLELAKRRGSIMERALSGGSTTAIDYFEAMPALRGIAARVPFGQRVVQETFGRAEAAWLGFGELARDEMWMAGKAILSAKGLPEAAMAGQLRELAHSLDLMTGVMSPQALGIPLSQQQIESAFMFFAPRYTRAGLSFAGNVLQGGLAGAEARKALAGFMLGGLTMYKAATEVLGQEMNLDPNSGRFMTIKIGDTYVGVGGIYYALMRLSADIASTAVEDPLAMLPTNLSRVDNPFYRFLYNRTAPLTGLTFGLAIEHKNFLGEPFENVGDYARFMAGKILPFSVASQMPWEKEPWQDSAFQPAELGAQLAGLRAFPESSWEARNNYRDNLAQDRYQRNWAQLNKVERKEIEQDYPILEKFDEYVSQQQLRRGELSDKLRSSWQQQIDDAQENRDELINRAATMAEQDRDYFTFRLRVKDIENDYGAVMASINSTKVYAPIMEAIRTPKTLEQLSVMDREEMAYNIWAQFRYSSQETPFGKMQNEIGEPVWDNIEKLRDWVRQQFGEEALRYIEQERPLAGRDLPQLYLELQQAEQVMKPYWAIREAVARLPWQRYADSPAGQRLMQRLITKRRKQMRLQNPQLERAFQMFYSQTK